MDKKITNLIIVGAIALVLGFVIGMQYGKTQARNNNFPGQQRMMQRRTGDNASFLVGEVIKKDDKSITIKNRDGGNKIVFFSPSTSIGKFGTTTIDQVTVGQTINARGQANPDGSVVSTMIQIMPEGGNMPGFGGPGQPGQGQQPLTPTNNPQPQ